MMWVSEKQQKSHLFDGKKWIVAILFILVPVSVFITLFARYNSTSNGYKFLHFRNWKTAEMHGLYFDGLVLSPNNLIDTENDFNKGGFIQISSRSVTGNSVKIDEYINNIKNEELLRVKNGGFPIAPGPSQYEYMGGKGFWLNDFARVSSLAAFADDHFSELYWKIENNTLYEVFVKYPSDGSKRADFTFALYLLMNTFRPSLGL